MSTNNQYSVKYAFDRIVALWLLTLVSPLLLVIAAAIKWADGGPVFFRQERHGIGGKLFSIYKFRSMIVDADRYLDDQGQVTVANRVTPVGRLIRATSLDELPQLINIARGEMSLVGPRPLAPHHYPKLNSTQRKRFAVRPGLTGLAQVNGRNQLRWSERLAYDVEYVDNYSFALDAKILLKTVRVVVLREGVVLDRNPEFADDLGEDNERARAA